MFCQAHGRSSGQVKPSPNQVSPMPYHPYVTLLSLKPLLTVWPITRLYPDQFTDVQTDTRIGSVEVKIKKLDAELGAFKQQMAKLRDGPGKVGYQRRCTIDHQAAIQQRALRTLKQKRMYENQLMQLQQQTWNMEQAAMTTENLKNTVSRRLSISSGVTSMILMADGHCGRDEDCKQGDEEAVQGYRYRQD